MKNFPILFLILLAIMSPRRLQAQSDRNEPRAHASAIVTVGNARFTVLTSRLIRLEWSDTSRFEDHASLVFINRRLPVPDFDTTIRAGWFTLTTQHLTLRYRPDGGSFTKDNLQISFTLNGKKSIWTPSSKDTGNLRGTLRTLDGVEGTAQLEPGLLSRDGWTLIDDSKRPVFDDTEWPWVMARPDTTSLDWYFFGYGREYKDLLRDFTLVAGRIPMPPRFAFGLWWSRYWSYTDAEFKQLVREFEDHGVPLDVLVIDMDWHLTFNLRWGRQPKDQAGQPLGWTGYTWDPAIFPDPKGFLAWCHERGLKTPLNLHPASGVQPHELRYPEMAAAMGIDPQTKQYVPFDIVDKTFASNYLNIMLRPLENEGVDFWWLDWQQWGTTKIPGVTPTWWLNYVHFTDMERQGKSRPLLFHRWGGLGNHRYQIGFSGDVISVWESLAFQPYFTATAANVGYGYWSHDIGGHIPGVVSPELYTRWIQFGIFSPIIRTHTTKNPNSERRIWAYPPEYYQAMRNAILLRYSLIPYLYTESRRTYDTGVSLCRPMYYEFPEAEEAYRFKGQYMFGERMIVAPITDSLDADTLLATKRIWLPEGEWIEWQTGASLRGPVTVKRTFALDEIPVYVRAGTILPMQLETKPDSVAGRIVFQVFPGDTGEYRMYDDEGNSTRYQRGEFAWTRVRTSSVKDGMKLEIFPTEGSYSGMPGSREYEIRWFGVLPPDSVTVDSRTIERGVNGWGYDGTSLTAVVPVPATPVGERVSVVLKWKSGSPRENTDFFVGRTSRLRKAMELINGTWPKEWSPDSLVRAVQTGNRMSIDPRTAREELARFNQQIPGLLTAIRKLDIDPAVMTRIVNHLASIRK